MKAVTPEECTCPECGTRTPRGRKVYYRGRLPFCSSGHAEAFDARLAAAADRARARDERNAWAYARKAGLLRAG